MLPIHQKLIKWLLWAGCKYRWSSSTGFMGSHAYFQFDSGIANGTSMPVTAGVQQSAAISVTVCKPWQRAATADTIKSEPLTRASWLPRLVFLKCPPWRVCGRRFLRNVESRWKNSVKSSRIKTPAYVDASPITWITTTFAIHFGLFNCFATTTHVCIDARQIDGV